MREKARRFAANAAAAMVLATLAAAIVHGAFHPMLIVFWIFFFATAALLIAGSILSLWWTRTHAVGRVLLRCGVITLLAIPLSFVASRMVVAFELWRAKRFVAATIVPQFEELRRTRGQYPGTRYVSFRENPPPGAPWLIRRFQYTSDGRSYALSVWDPGACGRIDSYSSATRQWVTTYQTCFY